MRVLVLSDIHSNLEALDAVLAAAHGAFDTLWNLGDTVGYGGSPNEVLDRIRPLAALNVRGNHDRVCCGLTSPRSTSTRSRARQRCGHAAELTPENLAWLRAVPARPTAPHRSPSRERTRRDLRAWLAARRGHLHPHHARRLGSAPGAPNRHNLLRPHASTGRLLPAGERVARASSTRLAFARSGAVAWTLTAEPRNTSSDQPWFRRPAARQRLARRLRHLRHRRAHHHLPPRAL